MTSKVLRKRLKSAVRVAELGVETVSAGARSLLSVAARNGRSGAPSPRNPYVQNVSASSAVIAWVGDEPDVGCVEYGETPLLGHRATDAWFGRRHAVTLPDLVPGSKYHYRVTEAGGASMTGRFRTAPADDESRFVFAVIGDSGNGKKNQLKVASLLEHLEPDLILHTGDVVYPSGEDRHYDRRFFVPYRRIIEEVPVFPTLGNHDVEKDNGAAYLKNFHLPRNEGPGAGRYYSFEWGGVHFVALDSELYYDDDSGAPEEQKAWLESDLEASERPWKIAYLHRPLYSSSNHGSDERIRENLEPVFVQHGVDVVFSGHDHVYERTVPIGGVTYIVAGGGGKELYPAGRSSWTACSRSAHHAVLVRVDGGRLSLEAVAPNGAVLDLLEIQHS